MSITPPPNNVRSVFRAMPLAFITAGLLLALALAILMVVIAFSAGAKAQEPEKLTILQCEIVLGGLQGLDGRTEMTKDGRAVTVPYQFGSARLRLAIQQNIARLNIRHQDFLKVQQDMFREVAGDAVEIKPNSPEMVRYQKMVLDAQQAPCNVELQRIKADDLKLDKNEIPGSVLGALDKILDR